METKLKIVDYELPAGEMIIVDLLCQINNLEVMLSKNYEKKEDMDRFADRALKTSIVLLLFSILEVCCNWISTIVIKTHKNANGSSNFITLNQIELDFLLEQKTVIDKSKKTLTVQNGAFVSIVDKLILYPFLLGKTYGLQFEIDKTNKNWDKIQQLKKIRDSLTHMKVDMESIKFFSEQTSGNLSLNPICPNQTIDAKDIFEYIFAVRWYISEIFSLFENIFKNHNRIKQNRIYVDFLFWMILLQLKNLSRISEKEFNKIAPAPQKISFKEQK